MGVLIVKPDWLERLCSSLETRAAESFTLNELADEAGVTPRALQYAFRQHLNTTPMRWLRQQRLKRVNTQLKNKSPGINVTQAAIASGFTNLGVFARYYREAFAEKPSETLKG